MPKLLILLALLPCALAFFVAKFFGARRLRSKRELAVNGEQMATKALASLGIDVVTRKSWWAGVNPCSKGKLYLSKQLCESQKINDVAQVLHICGLVLLESVHEKSVKQRYRAVRFASICPLFVLIGVVLAKVARARLPISWLLVVVVGAFALACIALLINLAVEKEAAKRAVRAMETSNLVPRLRDQEPLEEAIVGCAYLSVFPSMFRRFLLQSFEPKEKG